MGTAEKGVDEIKAELRKELISRRRETRRAYKSHYGEAETCRKCHIRYGMGAITCSLLAGSGFLADATSIHSNLHFLASLLTLVAVILTAMITFNRYDERSAVHLLSARKWEQMRDLIETLILELPRVDSPEALDKLLAQFKKFQKSRVAALEESAPLPGHQFRKHEHIADKNERIEVET